MQSEVKIPVESKGEKDLLSQLENISSEDILKVFIPKLKGELEKELKSDTKVTISSISFTIIVRFNDSKYALDLFTMHKDGIEGEIAVYKGDIRRYYLQVDQTQGSRIFTNLASIVQYIKNIQELISNREL